MRTVNKGWKFNNFCPINKSYLLLFALNSQNCWFSKSSKSFLLILFKMRLKLLFKYHPLTAYYSITYLELCVQEKFKHPIDLFETVAYCKWASLPLLSFLHCFSIFGKGLMLYICAWCRQCIYILSDECMWGRVWLSLGFHCRKLPIL